MKSHTVGIYYFGMTADSSKVKSTFAFLNEVFHLAPATIKLDDLIRFHIHQFNIDTACVELVFDDRIQISIDFTAVENEVADNRFQRSELDLSDLQRPACLCRSDSEQQAERHV